MINDNENEADNRKNYYLFKRPFRESFFFFNGKFKTISASVKFLFKVSTQEAKFSLFKNSN